MANCDGGEGGPSSGEERTESSACLEGTGRPSSLPPANKLQLRRENVTRASTRRRDFTAGTSRSGETSIHLESIAEGRGVFHSRKQNFPRSRRGEYRPGSRFDLGKIPHPGQLSKLFFSEPYFFFGALFLREVMLTVSLGPAKSYCKTCSLLQLVRGALTGALKCRRIAAIFETRACARQPR